MTQICTVISKVGYLLSGDLYVQA